MWRNGMWYKLIANGIHGNCFNYTFNYKKNMYMETKSVTDFFTCNDGVRQGEYLYPFFFSLYINDLDICFYERKVLWVYKLFLLKSIEEELIIWNFLFCYMQTTQLLWLYLLVIYSMHCMNFLFTVENGKSKKQNTCI